MQNFGFPIIFPKALFTYNFSADLMVPHVVLILSHIPWFLHATFWRLYNLI